MFLVSEVLVSIDLESRHMFAYYSGLYTIWGCPLRRIQKLLTILLQVEVQEKCPKQICIINTGKYSFEYCWELVDIRGVLMRKSLADLATMTILPLEGTAEPNERTMSELTFCPPSKMNLKGTELILKVLRIHLYITQISNAFSVKFFVRTHVMISSDFREYVVHIHILMLCCVLD